MMIGRIEGATRVLGKSQGYIGLPVRDENMVDGTTGNVVPTMTTAWFPDPAELAAINAGEAIHLRLFGSVHPPVYIGVGNAEKFPGASVELLEAAEQVCRIFTGNNSSLEDMAKSVAVLAGVLNR